MTNEHRSDDHPNISTWDGNFSTRASFSNEVKLWRLSENLEVNYSLASGLIRKLSGSARRAAANLDEALLHPVYVEALGIGETLASEPAPKAWRKKRGVEKVMAKLLAGSASRNRSEKASIFSNCSESLSTRDAERSASLTG